MLKNIDPLLGPELLAHLRAMGHGDEIAIVDGNFPAQTVAKRYVRCDGANTTTVLRAVLTVLPLDTYVPEAVHLMHVVGTQELPAIANEIRDCVRVQAGPEFAELGGMERHAFYDRARLAFVVVVTGETRSYGNVILTKGVIA